MFSFLEKEPFLSRLYFSLSPRHCREERAQGEGEEEQEEEEEADRKGPGAAQCLPRYRQGKPVKSETRRVDCGVVLFVFCKSAQSYSPLPDTGARCLCCSDRYPFPVTLWKEEPRWPLLFMLWFAAGDCEGGSSCPESEEGVSVQHGPGLGVHHHQVWGCRPPPENGLVHIYGKEDAQQAKCYFTCALYFSHCALSRIHVCGYLLNVTTCSRHLFPSKLLRDGTVLSWGYAAGIPAQFHSGSDMYIFRWGYA